jgi:plasmid stabilization system protein ParE
VSRKRRVVITGSAELDVQSIRDYIAKDRAKAAAKWVREFQRRARLLATMPLAFEIVPEVDQVGDSFRHIIFGNYRIIYYVGADQISVCRVIHAARVLTPFMLVPPPRSK